MKKLLIAACIALAGCNLTPPVAPSQVADRVTLDEEAAIKAEAMYQATAQFLLATGAAKLPAVKAADRRLYAAVLAVRAAYDAGNAKSYHDAQAAVYAAIAALVTAAKG